MRRITDLPPCGAFIGPPIYAALDRQVERMRYRYRLRTTQGGYIWLEDNTICFYDLHGRVEQSYVFSRNITDLAPTKAAFQEIPSEG